MSLTPRRLLLLLPMAFVLGVSTACALVGTAAPVGTAALVRTPAPMRMTAAVQTPAAVGAPAALSHSVRERVLVVGDSVPSRLFPAFQRALFTQGWQVKNGAKGSCPAIGVTITDSRGALINPKINCGDVMPPLQAQSVKEFAPTIVVAWSRYEMSDRLSDTGKHLAAGTAPFWQAQRVSLRTTINRLASGGAKVVYIKTDRPGQGMATRCTPASCPPVLRRLVDEDGLRVTWNKILVEEAARDPRLTVIGIDDLYCKDAAEPCNDRLADGTFARPDGTHFSKAYMPVVAKALAARLASVVAT